MMNWLQKVNDIQTINTSELPEKAKYNSKIIHIKDKILGHSWSFLSTLVLQDLQLI